MLFIGDIHIHPRYGSSLLEELRSYIDKHSDEQHIVFLGDYVYHFSYDRSSLLKLFELFLDLASQSKHVYILAGNHDRLGEHFVYSETEKFLKQAQHPFLHLITQPEQYTIEHQNFLFVPYLLSRSRYQPAQDHYENWPTEVQHLAKSKNDNELDSYFLNAYLEDQLHHSPSSIIVHHYYIADTRFPGLKASFRYQEKAISPHFLSTTSAKFVSGHIHHAFSFQNYLCIGSVWSTSPRDTNTLQFLAHYAIDQHHWTLSQIAPNPYLLIQQHTQTINTDTVRELWKTLQEKSESGAFVSDQFSISFEYCELPLERTSIIVESDDAQYDTIDEVIDPDLRLIARDTSLKAALPGMDEALNDLVDSNKDFSNSREGWKELLNTYLEKKFGERKLVYVDFLNKLDITI